MHTRRWLNKAVVAMGAVVGLALGAAGTARGDSVVWDYGPNTGSGLTGNAYSNQTNAQNFAEQVRFGADTTITGFNEFMWDVKTAFGLTNPTNFHLKLLADQSGQPGSVIDGFDLTPASTTFFTSGSTPLAEYDFTFGGITLQANTTYWIGVSANNGAGTQALVGGEPGGDGKVAQFSGSTYTVMAPLGDQMFQLVGHDAAPVTAVPLPTTAWAGLGLLGCVGAAQVTRRRSGASV